MRVMVRSVCSPQICPPVLLLGCRFFCVCYQERWQECCWWAGTVRGGNLWEQQPRTRPVQARFCSCGARRHSSFSPPAGWGTAELIFPLQKCLPQWYHMLHRIYSRRCNLEWYSWRMVGTRFLCWNTCLQGNSYLVLTLTCKIIDKAWTVFGQYSVCHSGPVRSTTGAG